MINNLEQNQEMWLIEPTCMNCWCWLYDIGRKFTLMVGLEGQLEVVPHATSRPELQS